MNMQDTLHYFQICSTICDLSLGSALKCFKWVAGPPDLGQCQRLSFVTKHCNVLGCPSESPENVKCKKNKIQL